MGLDLIQKKLEALEEWQKTAERRVIAEARQFEPEIIDYNTETQLFQKGQYATGSPITPPYAALTREIKRAKGQPTDRVTLRDTGDFHSSFEVIWRDTEFELTATDPKTRKLQRDYSPDIFGLDDNGLQELIDMLRPELINNLNSAL